jgi:hypothetical protein
VSIEGETRHRNGSKPHYEKRQIFGQGSRNKGTKVNHQMMPEFVKLDARKADGTKIGWPTYGSWNGSQMSCLTLISRRNEKTQRSPPESTK